MYFAETETDLENSLGEELIVRVCRRTGLKAVLAINSTQLGPAAGGCRRWTYASDNAAIYDAQRLSSGMTMKNALAQIPFGGGKSVIVADTKQVPSAEQLQVFASWINELNGRYVTAEDVGMGVAQMLELAKHSSFVSGLGNNGVGGDPSPKTARGVFLGLKRAVQTKLAREHLYGLKVAVQGLGNVGMSLCHQLARAGAELFVADVNPNRVKYAERKYDAVSVAVDDIAELAVDVFAPCALGGVITEAIATTTPVQVIAGAANNQLANERCAEILAERGVLYAPDFVINAGGVISVAHEYLLGQDGFSEVSGNDADLWVGGRIEAIADRLETVLQVAHSRSESTHQIAKEMAQKAVQKGKEDSEARMQAA